MIREEIYEELNSAIKELPELSQEIFALYVSGKSDSEIAELLSIDMHVVRVNRKETILFLKNKLRNQFYWFLWMRRTKRVCKKGKSPHLWQVGRLSMRTL